MFLDYKDISSREAYEYYRENRKITSKTINQYNYYKKAVVGIFAVIRDLLSKNEEGVCIRDLGYFCMLRSKDKKNVMNIYHYNSILKKRVRKYTYRPYYFPDVMYEGWHIEGAFTFDIPHFREEIQYKIRKTVCDSVIVMEDFVLRAKNNRTNYSRNAKYKKEARK